MRTSVAALASLASHALAVVNPRQSKDQLLTPHNFPTLNTTRLRTRHGPLPVPGTAAPEAGMQSFADTLPFPCTDCIVTGLVADLEFEDGSPANAHTGMWLHHTLLTTVGGEDETCGEDVGVKRIWASGNERTAMDFTNGGTRKAGIYLGQEPIAHITELMNEAPEARDAYLVLEVEFLPLSTPDFRPATPLYLDVAGLCTDGAVAVPEEPVFNRSIEWTVGYPGEILSVFGHLHDGGTTLEVGLDGEVTCEHVARYGESDEFITHADMFDDPENEDGHEEPSEGHDHSSQNQTHISSITHCEDLGRFGAGAVFSLTAYYDMGAHEPMAGHHGGLEPVMGISLVYVLEDEPGEEEAGGV